MQDTINKQDPAAQLNALGHRITERLARAAQLKNEEQALTNRLGGLRRLASPNAADIQALTDEIGRKTAEHAAILREVEDLRRAEFELRAIFRGMSGGARAQRGREFDAIKAEWTAAIGDLMPLVRRLRDAHRAAGRSGRALTDDELLGFRTKI